MKTTDSSSSIRSGTHEIHTDTFELRYAGATDIGKRRTVNQDRFLLIPNHRVFLVADGMGGHAAGEVAARIAVDMVGMYFQERAANPHLAPQARDDYPAEHLASAVRLANTAIFQESVDNPDKQGMGTTLVALHIDEERACWAHVGDSRLYRVRQGEIEQLTRDHSLLNQTLEQQNFSDEERVDFIENFPYKNVLIRALGVRYHVDVDFDDAPVEDGDVFILTSDGAHNQIADRELRDIILEHCHPDGEPQGAADAIIRIANERGGPDNITVAVIDARRR